MPTQTSTQLDHLKLLEPLNLHYGSTIQNGLSLVGVVHSTIADLFIIIIIFCRLLHFNLQVARGAFIPTTSQNICLFYFSEEIYFYN